MHEKINPLYNHLQWMLALYVPAETDSGQFLQIDKLYENWKLEKKSYIYRKCSGGSVVASPLQVACCFVGSSCEPPYSWTFWSCVRAMKHLYVKKLMNYYISKTGNKRKLKTNNKIELITYNSFTIFYIFILIR